MKRTVSLTTVVERPQGVVFYRGPSAYDGSPVMAIATGLNNKSDNRKTGSMVQTYILPDNGKKPYENVFDGTDAGACGDCPHRYADGGAGTCYVNPATGPNAVWHAYLNDSYPTVTPERLGDLTAGRLIRLGAYGDPAMIPIAAWRSAVARAAGCTGYTHQWRRRFARDLRAFCMASVESERERAYAARLGWRTFRVRPADDPLAANEIVCPASEEGGKRKTCETCRACSGGNPAKASVAIVAHGPTWKVGRLLQVLKAKRQRKALPVFTNSGG